MSEAKDINQFLLGLKNNPISPFKIDIVEQDSDVSYFITIFQEKINSEYQESLKQIYRYILENKYTFFLIIKKENNAENQLILEFDNSYYSYIRLPAKLTDIDFISRLLKTQLIFNTFIETLIEKLAENNYIVLLDIWISKLISILKYPKENAVDLIVSIIYFLNTQLPKTQLTQLNQAFTNRLSCILESSISNDPEVDAQYFNNFKDKESLKGLLLKLNKEYAFFLHSALKFNHLAFFNEFLPLLKQDNLLDNKNNSLLYVCSNNLSALEVALKYTQDINQCNINGNTALHKAAVRGELTKTRFLLKNGANPHIKNNKGQSYLEIEEEKSSDLSRYRQCKKEGNALSFPPEIIKQKGPNCGFYATACVANFFKTKDSSGFQKKEAYVAKKSDSTPKASTSLRQIRSTLGLNTVGGLFSVQEITKVIEYTENQVISCNIDDINIFTFIIKLAIDKDLPLIVPFSFDAISKPNATEASNAHWATIIGYNSQKESLLIAQYGKYEFVSTKRLFHAFFYIEETFPNSFLYKKDKEWLFAENREACEKAERIVKIPEMSLKDFRRKLLIICPPGYEMEKIKKEITPVTSLFL